MWLLDIVLCWYQRHDYQKCNGGFHYEGVVLSINQNRLGNDLLPSGNKPYVAPFTNMV